MLPQELMEHLGGPRHKAIGWRLIVLWLLQPSGRSTLFATLHQNRAAMQVTPAWNSFIRSEAYVAQLSIQQSRITVFLQIIVIMLLILPFALHAQNVNQPPYGIAWRVSGVWQTEGEKGPISTGDAIVPGSLLRPGGTRDHSITVLLPDGQRILYECFTPQDCVRGFRVPSLYRMPKPIAIDLLARANSVLPQKQSDQSPVRSQGEPRIPRDEAVAVLESGSKAEIAGLATALSNGSYWYEVRPFTGSAGFQPRREVEKTAQSITLMLPSVGLFDVLIVDRLNTPRIDLLVAAIPQPRAETLLKSFREIQALLRDWNENYQGWPIHDFQRAYLRSLMLGIRPSAPSGKSIAIKNHDIGADVTSEPRFSPSPGVLSGDTEVSLHCDTPGASMHYTVDGSQPSDTSAVYRAPVVVKGTALTIKAFAASKGKKDSPVVTGIFRIGD